MTGTKAVARVRLTDDAVEDLLRLKRKDPQIVRAVLKKMLLLERSPKAGEPLLGALVGFRKLVVGNRDYRIVWRETRDVDQTPVLVIAEVWAAGARADSEIYKEMNARLERATSVGHPAAHELAAVLEKLGKRYFDLAPNEEPKSTTQLPGWLVEALRANLQLSCDELSALTQDEAQRLLAEYWSRG